MGLSLPWFLFAQRLLPCVWVRPVRKVILEDAPAFRDSFIAERGKLAGMRSVPRHSGLVPLGDQNVLWLAHCTTG